VNEDAGAIPEKKVRKGGKKEIKTGEGVSGNRLTGE